MARKKRTTKSKARSATNFVRQLSEDGLKSVYLVVGVEDFLRRDVVLRIRRAAFDGEEDSPSLAEFDGASVALSKILDEARTMPFLGGNRRVVIVQKAEALLAPAPASASAQQKNDREVEIKALLRYVAAPVDSSSLVLVSRSLDKRRKTTKQLLEIIPMISCETPAAPALRHWIVGLAKDPPFGPGAADILIERCGGGQLGLGQLAAEVKKLQSLAVGKKAIDRKMVESVVAESHSDGFFDLLGPMNSGRTEKALEIVGYMIRDGARDKSGKVIRDISAMTSMAIGAISWDLRTLWRAYSLIKEGRGHQEAKSALKTYRADDFIRRARRTNSEALAARHEALRKADLGAKGYAPPAENFMGLVLTLSLIAKGESRNV
jgi:DNA polymerase III subunit delta